MSVKCYTFIQVFDNFTVGNMLSSLAIYVTSFSTVYNYIVNQSHAMTRPILFVISTAEIVSLHYTHLVHIYVVKYNL